jgi:O-methyltransferase
MKINKYIFKIIKKTLNKLGIEIHKIQKTSNSALDSKTSDEFASVPDREMYMPLFSPSFNNGKGEFKEIMNKISKFTLVSPDRCYVLYTIAKQLQNIEGEFYECGVYKGGTALLIAEVINYYNGEYSQNLHLFDTFEGMPETNNEKDWHKKGDFADTSIESVQERLTEYSKLNFYKGYIPSTFDGLENNKVSFAHIDVDIYKSIIDCCTFIYPRMSSGGMFVFDDYGFITCPGARMAVDDFFRDKKEQPLVLPTGQAIVVKI